MKKHKRDQHSIKADQTIHHEELAGTRPSDKAKERFRRPAYQARGMIREQGRQMERMSAAEYLAKKYNIRGDGVGQKDSD